MARVVLEVLLFRFLWMLIIYGERSPCFLRVFGGREFGAPLFLPRLVSESNLEGRLEVAFSISGSLFTRFTH